MPTAANNPLATDPEMLAAFRERVVNEDWTGARRLSLAMQLHRLTPQKLMERDDVYLRRLARRHAVRAAQRAVRHARSPASGWKRRPAESLG